MILNSYALLALLMDLIRFPMAIMVLVIGVPAVLRCGRALSGDQRREVENRSYLLLILALTLLALNVLSWPLLYWLLQSYVPEWPGVMCVYGVTQIGVGSTGAGRFLPGLITALQLGKPLLLLVGGGWFVVYCLNRSTESATLMRPVLLGVLLIGLLSTADATVEAAYLLIPKQENLPNVGCCTARLTGDAASAFVPRGWVDRDQTDTLSTAYFGLNGVVIAALLGQLTVLRGRWRAWSLAALLSGTFALSVVAGLFLLEVAAPTILQLPHHHCAYDLLAVAPESVLGIAFFLFASFAVAWSCIAGWYARLPETAAVARRWIDKLMFGALFGYLASLVLFAVELALNAT